MGEFWFLETMLDTLFAKMIDFRFLKTMQNFTILIIDFIQLTYTNFGADRNDEGEPLFTTSIKWDIFSTLEGIRYLQILHEIYSNIFSSHFTKVEFFTYLEWKIWWTDFVWSLFNRAFMTFNLISADSLIRDCIISIQEQHYARKKWISTVGRPYLQIHHRLTSHEILQASLLFTSHKNMYIHIIIVLHSKSCQRVLAWKLLKGSDGC